MHLNNNLIVFDLETTNDPDEKAIIEIGATIVTKELERNLVFKGLVYPDLSVSDFVLELTGYKLEVLQSAEKFPIVAKRFEDWVIQHCGNIKNVRLAAWGNYFDVNVLRSQYKKYNLEFPFSGTVIDIKSIAFAYMALSGRRTDSFGGVQKVAELLNIKPPLIGKWHNGDFDAIVTADIFIECMKRMNEGVWIDKRYIQIKPENTLDTI